MSIWRAHFLNGDAYKMIQFARPSWLRELHDLEVSIKTEVWIVFVVGSAEQGGFEGQTLPVFGKNGTLLVERLAQLFNVDLAVKSVGRRADRIECSDSFELCMCMSSKCWTGDRMGSSSTISQSESTPRRLARSFVEAML